MVMKFINFISSVEIFGSLLDAARFPALLLIPYNLYNNKVFNVDVL